ncbi:MAG: hypothetical protein Q9170_005089 [Blastenia crenularia]
MKANRRDVSKQNMTEDEMEVIAATCRQFKELQLTIPILSVFEKRETRIRENLLAALRPKKKPATLLASRAMVEIKSQKESMFEADKNHLDLCDIEVNGLLYFRLIKFFSVFAEHAPANVQLVSRQITYDEPERSKLRTQSSISSFREASSVTPDTPQNASKDAPGTQGSSSNAQPSLGEDQPESEYDYGQQAGKGVQLPFSHIASISRNEVMYGRKDILDKIDHAFGLKISTSDDAVQTNDQEESLWTPRSYVLYGMGGIGKTETAIEYLYSRRDRFDAVIWVYADTTRKLGAQFVTLAQELGQEAASDSMDEISAREVVKAWLAAPVGYRTKHGKSDKVNATWLMIFDNADDPDVLYDWLPTQGPGCVLVTGKYPYTKETSYKLSNGLGLELFSSEAGGEMLRGLSGRKEGPRAMETSNRISDLLGGLPLAIAQMSAIIRRKHLTLDDFEDWYREDSKDLLDLRIGEMQTKYQYTLGTTWAVEQLDPFAFSLLKVLSVLDPDRIPEELLMDGINGVELPNYPLKRSVYLNARAQLIHSSMVIRNMATNELRIHRIVQDVVRQKMEKTELQSVFATVMSLLSAVWPYVSGTDPTRNQLWRIPIAEKYIFERGLPDQTTIFASLARMILNQALYTDGDKERITHWLGEARHNLSLAAVMTGSSDGMDDAKLWLDILQDRAQKYKSSAEELALATAFNQLGICHIRKDEANDAMKSWEQSVAIFAGLKSAPDLSGTFPRLQLALLYTLQNRPTEAEAVLKPTLEEHERILGIDDKTTTESGHIWRAMGNICNAQQRYKEGLKYHERALANMKVTLGEKHYFTGDCFYSLAVDYVRHGQEKEALENLDAAIGAFTAETHREAQAARAIWKKGCVLKVSGDLLASEELFKRAMQIRQSLVPDDVRQVNEVYDKDWADPIFFWSR